MNKCRKRWLSLLALTVASGPLVLAETGNRKAGVVDRPAEFGYVSPKEMTRSAAVPDAAGRPAAIHGRKDDPGRQSLVEAVSNVYLHLLDLQGESDRLFLISNYQDGTRTFSAEEHDKIDGQIQWAAARLRSAVYESSPEEAKALVERADSMANTATILLISATAEHEDELLRRRGPREP